MTWSKGRALCNRVFPGGRVIGVLAPTAHADNKRLNESVFVNIYTAQKNNGYRPRSALRRS